MQFQIHCEPTYSLLEVELTPGESIASESGAMAWMSPTIRAQTAVRGGLMAGLKRAMLTGESFFQNTYTAENGTGTVAFAPGASGDIVPLDLDGELFLEKGAYLASEPGLSCDSKWQGLKGLFNEGLFALRVTGQGQLFFNGYGAIHEIEVNGEYVVDNGFAVAWEPTLQYRVTRSRTIRSFLFANQLLLRFQGQGRVWVQSRSPRSLANWVHPFRPVKSSN